MLEMGVPMGCQTVDLEVVVVKERGVNPFRSTPIDRAYT